MADNNGASSWRSWIETATIESSAAVTAAAAAVVRFTIAAAVAACLARLAAFHTPHRLTETTLRVELLLTCREGELLAAVAARHGLVSVLTHGNCPPSAKETSAMISDVFR